MKTEEIVQALRCVSSAWHEAGCESCSYYRAEHIPEDMRETFGNDVLYSCDIDRVGLDGADLIQKLTDRCARYAEEIAVLQERTRWIPVEERLPEISRSLGGASDIVLGLISNPAGYPPPNPGLCVCTEAGEWMCRGLAVTVTHWMPLPDGPEVVEHD